MASLPESSGHTRGGATKVRCPRCQLEITSLSPYDFVDCKRCSNNFRPSDVPARTSRSGRRTLSRKAAASKFKSLQVQITDDSALFDDEAFIFNTPDDLELGLERPTSVDALRGIRISITPTNATGCNEQDFNPNFLSPSSADSQSMFADSDYDFDSEDDMDEINVPFPPVQDPEWLKLKEDFEQKQEEERRILLGEDKMSVVISKIEAQFKSKVKLQKEGREFIRSGQLLRVTLKGFRRYTFHLFNDILMYSHKTPKGFKLHHTLQLSELVLKDMVDKKNRFGKDLKNAFGLKTSSKTIVVCAETADQKQLWVYDIIRSIAPHMNDTNSSKSPQEDPPELSRSNSNSKSGTMLGYKLVRQRSGSRSPTGSLSRSASFSNALQNYGDETDNIYSKELTEIELQFRTNVRFQKEGRTLVRSGELEKVTRRGPRKYMFHLFDDILCYSVDSSLGFKLHRVLDVASLRVTDHDSSKSAEQDLQYAFQIQSDEKSFIVCASSQELKEYWMLDLTKCMAPFMSKSEEVEDGKDKKAPILERYASSKSCQVCRSAFSAFSRKHNCKKCGALVCGDCSPDRVAIEADSRKVRVCIWCVDNVERD